MTTHPEEPKRRLLVRDPADNSLVTDLPCATIADVAGAVACARGVAPAWGAVAPADRAALVLAAAERVRARADELAQLVTREMGKPIADAHGGVDAAVSTLRQYAELGPVHRGSSLAGGPGAT